MLGDLGLGTPVKKPVKLKSPKSKAKFKNALKPKIKKFKKLLSDQKPAKPLSRSKITLNRKRNSLKRNSSSLVKNKSQSAKR